MRKLYAASALNLILFTLSACEGTGGAQSCSVTPTGTRICTGVVDSTSTPTPTTSDDTTSDTSTPDSDTTSGGDTSDGSSGSSGDGSTATPSPTPTLNISDLKGYSWNSTCIADESLSSGGMHSYYESIRFQTWSAWYASRVYYDNTNCWYNGTSVFNPQVDGSTVTIGTRISGSIFPIQFTATSSSGRTYAAAVNWMTNTGCPTGPGPWGNGTTLSLTGIACAFMTQPSVGQLIDNVIRLADNKLSFQLGGSSAVTSGPGVFHGGVELPATTPSITYTRQ